MFSAWGVSLACEVTLRYVAMSIRTRFFSFGTLLFAGVFVPITIVVSSLLVVEGKSVERELSIALPKTARPGSEIPLRAIVVSLTDSIQGPKIVSADVKVQLLDHGKLVGEAALLHTASQSSEGSLHIPDGTTGTLHVVAASLSGPPATVETDITIAPFVEPPDTKLRSPFTAPADVRVVGGACIPETPCDFMVMVGAGAYASITPSGAFTPAVTTPVYTQGMEHFKGVVHGLDALITMVVAMAQFRDMPIEQLDKSEREIRLPVALGQPTVELDEILVKDGSKTNLRLYGVDDSKPVIVDEFYKNAWIKSVTLEGPFGAAHTTALPFTLTGIGEHCLQFRTDVFGSVNAATRCVRVVEHGDTRNPNDTDAYYELAAHEVSALLVPFPASGRDAAELHLAENKKRFRAFAVAFVIALGLFVTTLVARRGNAVNRESQALMIAAGDSASEAEERKKRDRLTLLAAIFGVLLAFLAVVAAALIRSLI